MKMKKFYILSFIISFCFFISFIMTRNIILTILSIMWAIIGLEYLNKYKINKRLKKRKSN